MKTKTGETTMVIVLRKALKDSGFRLRRPAKVAWPRVSRRSGVGRRVDVGTGAVVAELGR